MQNESGSRFSNTKMCTHCSTLFEDVSLLICPKDGTPLLKPGQIDEVVGMELNGRYLVKEQLHKGRTATIYRAVHTHFDREVAIKVLNPTSSTTKIKRFQQEAQAASHLSHVCIVLVFDYGFIENTEQPYIVQDYLRGENLHVAVIQDGPPTLNRFKKLFWNICGALAYAHDRGVIHRDVRPSHIMLTRSPEGEEIPTLIDFHLAKLKPSSGKKEQALTLTGERLGTPPYLSPEQFMGQQVDERADIYALGCCMYFALTGELPFSFRDDISFDTKEKHVLKPEQVAKLPAQLKPIILKAMALDRQDRFQSMDELGLAVGDRAVDKRSREAHK